MGRDRSRTRISGGLPQAIKSENRPTEENYWESRRKKDEECRAKIFRQINSPSVPVKRQRRLTSMQREERTMEKENEKDRRSPGRRTSSEASTVPATSPQLRLRTMMQTPYQPTYPGNEPSSEEDDSPPSVIKGSDYGSPRAPETSDAKFIEALKQLVEARKKAGSTLDELISWATEKLLDQWWPRKDWDEFKVEPKEPESSIGFDDTGPQESQEGFHYVMDWRAECKHYLATANLKHIQRGIDVAFERAFTPPGHSPRVTLQWTARPPDPIQLAHALECFFGDQRPKLPVKLLWKAGARSWGKIDRHLVTYVETIEDLHVVTFNISIPPRTACKRLSKITIVYNTSDSRVTTSTIRHNYMEFLENLVGTLGHPSAPVTGAQRKAQRGT